MTYVEVKKYEQRLFDRYLIASGGMKKVAEGTLRNVEIPWVQLNEDEQDKLAKVLQEYTNRLGREHQRLADKMRKVDDLLEEIIEEFKI